jgi:phosphoribosyl 1,2-cyclic phosphate phosphodiesterase
MASQVELLLLGTGTSAGVPMIGCHCGVCRSTDPRDHRNRPSAMISYGGVNVLVDTSPELRLQCLRFGIDMIESVVYTHAHADHIMGLDDLRRFNALKKGPLDIWADRPTHDALSRCFFYAFEDPSPWQKIFRPVLNRRLIEGSFEIAGQTWIPIPLLHGEQPILGFRVGGAAYCTDVSEIPTSSLHLLRDLDLLVLDALQPTPHTTHFSLSQAVEAAGRIGARLTLFTHIAHTLPYEATNARLPKNMRLGYDGERVVVTGSPGINSSPQ